MLTRSKYKTELPSDTIAKAKDVLESVGIKTELKKISVLANGISCRLVVVNQGLQDFNIGTNGKGMNEEYAMASAYGEMMERLQNKYLFRENQLFATARFIKRNPSQFGSSLNKQGKIHAFQYFPDEEELSFNKDEFERSVIQKFFPSYVNKLNLIDPVYTSLFAPFVDYTTGLCELFPIEYYRAIAGSNGLCAGNSKEEAIVQGLNEICERYVLMRLYTKQESLPRIALDLFEGHNIYYKLKELESKYKVIICDCSLGEELPVIGLLLINNKDGSYAFKLGGDYNMITALERCYTEIFQGKSDSSQVFKQYTAEDPLNAIDFHDALFTGTGNTPHCVLRDPHSSSCYPHVDFDNYKDELSFFITYFQKKGLHVYIKDNSFLGFPAYSIYIPGFSEIDTCLFDVNKMLRKKQRKYSVPNVLLNLSEAFDNHMYDELIDELGSDYMLHLQKWNTAPSAHLLGELLGTFIYASKGDYNSAEQQLKKVIECFDGQKEIPVDIQCTYNVLKLLEEERSLDDARIVYGEDMVDNVLNNLLNTSDYFKSLPIPTCFNCDRCKIALYCHMDEIIAIEGRLQNKQLQFHGYNKRV